MSSNGTGNQRADEEIRIAKMISEGGLGVEAYYYYRYDETDDSPESKVIRVGGLDDELDDSG